MRISLCHRLSAAAATGVLLAALTLAGCSSSPSQQAAGSISLSAGVSSLSVGPNTTSSAVQLIVTRAGRNQDSIAFSASNLPAGVTASFVQPAFGTYGSVSFTTSVNTTPGNYTITLNATSAIANTSQTLALTLMAADSITITPAANTAMTYQAGAAASINFTVARSVGNTAAVTVSATGLPTGLSATFTQPGTGASGSVSFVTASGSTTAAAGTYPVSLQATDGTATTTAAVNVTVGLTVTVANAVNTSQGINGKLQEFLSTGFQPAQYTNGFFVTFLSTADLTALAPHHIRLQPTHYDLPWITNSSMAQASDWSFTLLDQTVQPVLEAADQSPMFQIAQAPSFLNDASGHFVFNTANLNLFAQYAANLVRYYNKGGFDVGSTHFQSKSSHPITWWAIFNEPNLNNITPAQYVTLYNTLVPAMLAVDPTLKFVAMELSGYSGQAQLWMPTLTAATGLTAQVNAFSTHYYGTCKQADTDAAVFTKVATFASDLTYIRGALQARFPNTPVWVTENNVNADFVTTTGLSSCNGNTFVTDQRGTSAFFTSWRPFLFSQLGKVGNQSLYHFLYNGDAQFGEINQNTAGKTLSYWTDYELAHLFPNDGTAATSASILTTTSTEPASSVEVLAVHNADNSVTLMLTPIAPNASADNNGPGAPRTVKLDLSALGSFQSGTRFDVNSSTSATTGPIPTSFTPASTTTLVFTGYGTTFLTLKP